MSVLKLLFNNNKDTEFSFYFNYNNNDNIIYFIRINEINCDTKLKNGF